MISPYSLPPSRRQEVPHFQTHKWSRNKKKNWSWGPKPRTTVLARPNSNLLNWNLLSVYPSVSVNPPKFLLEGLWYRLAVCVSVCSPSPSFSSFLCGLCRISDVCEITLWRSRVQWDSGTGWILLESPSSNLHVRPRCCLCPPLFLFSFHMQSMSYQKKIRR
jgi:hypothetical protein